MSISQKIIYAVAGLLLGFAVGFAFANSVNRAEQDKLRAEVARLRASSGTGQATEKNGTSSSASSGDAANPTLSDAEIRQKIAQADRNPSDIEYQRNLGRGLYLYAVNFNKPELLPDIIRLLKRVSEAEPKDDNSIILIGNAHFLLAQQGDTAQFDEARGFYQKALELKPDDIYARTALGLCYYFDKPSDPRRAIAEFRKSLARDPRHEMTLQGLAAALIATGELTEAQKRIDELQAVNASNAELPNLRAQLSQKKNAAPGGSAGASGVQN